MSSRTPGNLQGGQAGKAGKHNRGAGLALLGDGGMSKSSRGMKCRDGWFAEALFRWASGPGGVCVGGVLNLLLRTGPFKKQVPAALAHAHTRAQEQQHTVLAAPQGRTPTRRRRPHATPPPRPCVLLLLLLLQLMSTQISKS